MARATVTSKGQITIPKEIRDRLGLSPGDGLEFLIDAEGNLVGKPMRRSGTSELAGSLKHLAGEAPVTLAEMDDVIRRFAMERDARTRTRSRNRGRLLGDGGSEGDPAAEDGGGSEGDPGAEDGRSSEGVPDMEGGDGTTSGSSA